MNTKLRKILISVTIAGIYAALTLAFMPISFGPINFRISEALTLLPFFSPYAVAGVTLGCLLICRKLSTENKATCYFEVHGFCCKSC